MTEPYLAVSAVTLKLVDRALLEYQGERVFEQLKGRYISEQKILDIISLVMKYNHIEWMEWNVE